MVSRILSVVLISVFVVVIGIGGVYAKSKIQVLFIGNSLTSLNSGVPRNFSDIATAKGYQIEYRAYTPGGATFEDHNRNEGLLDILKGRSWDYVVLQEQSQRPAWPDHQLEKDIFVHAKGLVDKVRGVNPDTKVVFYMTIARKYGDPMNVRVVPQVGTYEGMQERINAGYAYMAGKNDAMLAPVGLVALQMRQAYPGIELYMDDLHPNAAGAYLGGCTLFTTIFQQSCQGAELSYPLSKGQMRIIRGVVDQTLLSP